MQLWENSPKSVRILSLVLILVFSLSFSFDYAFALTPPVIDSLPLRHGDQVTMTCFGDDVQIVMFEMSGEWPRRIMDTGFRTDPTVTFNILPHVDWKKLLIGCWGENGGQNNIRVDFHRDDDNDMVYDHMDLCPDTPLGAEVNHNGCPDTDMDYIFDDFDLCIDWPETWNNFEDEDGCPDSITNPFRAMPFSINLIELHVIDVTLNSNYDPAISSWDISEFNIENMPGVSIKEIILSDEPSNHFQVILQGGPIIIEPEHTFVLDYTNNNENGIYRLETHEKLDDFRLEIRISINNFSEDAIMNYNPDTKEITVTTNYDTSKCIVKTDFSTPIHDNPDYTLRYMTPNYLTLYPDSEIKFFGAGNWETIPCQGTFTIDINEFLSNIESPAILPLDFAEWFITVRNSDLVYHNGLVDEIYIRYQPNSIIPQENLAGFCQERNGPSFYIDKYGVTQLESKICEPHFTPFYPIVEESKKEKKKSGSSCSGDCEPPTGYKNKSGQKIVKNGFAYNYNATDLTDYHTPYHKITVNTNQTHNLTAKGYDNSGVNNIKCLQIGFGMPEIGSPLNDAQSLITICFDNTEIEKITTNEKYPLVDIVGISTDIVECGYSQTECLEISLDHVFRDQPKYDVVAVQWMDNYRYSKTYFVNDGVEVVGESLNKPLLDTVLESKGGAFYPHQRGLVDLKLVDYKTDTWQDEYGYFWTSDNFGSFEIISEIPMPAKKPDKITSNMDRIHSEFHTLTEQEIKRALEHFDSAKLISKMSDPILSKNIYSETNEQIYELNLEYKKTVEAYNAEKFLMDSVPDHTKFQEFYMEYDEMTKKYEALLLQISEQIQQLESQASIEN